MCFNLFVLFVILLLVVCSYVGSSIVFDVVLVLVFVVDVVYECKLEVFEVFIGKMVDEVIIKKLVVVSGVCGVWVVKLGMVVIMDFCQDCVIVQVDVQNCIECVSCG